MSTLSNAAIRDIETVIHPYTNLDAFRKTGPLILDRGEGIRVWDTDGNEYIEGMAGLWCTALGYSEQELIDAATEQMGQLPFTHVFSGKTHEKAAELAERIKAIAPHDASKVLFCGSGSEANDQQIKLVWYYNNARGKPEKKKIISRIRGYHGVTVASASLTGLPANHADFDLPLDGILHTDCPHYYRYAEPGETEDEFTTRLANNLDEMIQREGPDTIAAFIAEPIMGAGGVVIPPDDYFAKIHAVLDKYDIYVIADEVICGFGRTGNMFGSETFGLKPDSISVAKALSSAYVPIGAVTVEEDMYEAMLEQSKKIGTFGHGFTYTAHPLAAAVACKTLEIYEKRDIVNQVRGLSPTFEKRVAALADHPLVGNSRAKGLIGAVELVADKATKRAFDASQGVGVAAQNNAQKHGLIVRAMGGDIVAFCPPLIIDDAQINEMFDKFEKGLDDTEAWVTKEGLR
ncbi:MAG: aspartate aminotransferase family protein [Parvibaculaceae bacterium]|nr:aspartate aminotransferase family protein [Parvibaculaceae bacterium]|tara:strand:- start:1989 stop:3371 length:1383 start_codon:yes stop_codon:yes gene_type:complete